jgi:hypothetical protein
MAACGVVVVGRPSACGGLSLRETAYLLKSETMKRRLLVAKQRQEGISLETVIEKLGT